MMLISMMIILMGSASATFIISMVFFNKLCWYIFYRLIWVEKAISLLFYLFKIYLSILYIVPKEIEENYFSILS